jgi:hypothetical protein
VGECHILVELPVVQHMLSCFDCFLS